MRLTATLPEPGRSTLDFRSLPAVRSLLVDAAGCQHAVLQSGPLMLTLRVDGSNVLDGPFNYAVSLRDRDGVAASPPLLALFLHLTLPGSPIPREFRRAGYNHPRLIEALAALDAHLAGASHREICGLLFGPDRARDDWHQPWMKLRVLRAIGRGRDYANGQYRALLR